MRPGAGGKRCPVDNGPRQGKKQRPAEPAAVRRVRRCHQVQSLRGGVNLILPTKVVTSLPSRYPETAVIASIT